MQLVDSFTSDVNVLSSGNFTDAHTSDGSRRIEFCWSWQDFNISIGTGCGRVRIACTDVHGADAQGQVAEDVRIAIRYCPQVGLAINDETILVAAAVITQWPLVPVTGQEEQTVMITQRRSGQFATHASAHVAGTGASAAAQTAWALACVANC